VKIQSGIACCALLIATSGAWAQQAPAAPAEPPPFAAGMPLAPTGNVKVFGGVVSAESCSYDEASGLIVVPNRGATQMQVPNDGYVSLLNHDGSIHTLRWIGVNRNGLILNQPLGSDIVGGKLYLADKDGDTADNPAQNSVIRVFDMATGAPSGEIVTMDAPWFNDIEVAEDGTIYASVTGNADGTQPWRIFRITPDGVSSIFKEGAPLKQPNGVAFDSDGNIVVVQLGDNAVLTFSPAGDLLATENTVDPGNDGLVIMPDGVKYVSSVRAGTVSKIVPGQPAQLIASGIPTGASMCYDSGANQLILPMNNNNALAFVPLG